MMNQSLVGWITERLDEWRVHRDSNYSEKWDMYERAWRGVWSSADKNKDSERSRIVSPATQQAVEAFTSEIDEAIWGTGQDLFDIKDDFQDQNPQDIALVKQYMKEAMERNQARKLIGDVNMLAAVYGTGIAEIPVESSLKHFAMLQDGQVTRGSKSVIDCKPLPISPRNFLIDPAALSVDEGLGVAIEENVGASTIYEGIEKGFYNDVEIHTGQADSNLEPSKIEKTLNGSDTIILTRYYGKVPRALLAPPENPEDLETVLTESPQENHDYKDLVEAIVVLANNAQVLKAVENPYIMQDRPVAAYPCESIPNRFWGRGIAEKASPMQKALDAQLRSHLDSLALTTVPMMAMDATRLPRGAKYEVKAGKNLLTNGNPNEILMPFTFGHASPENLQTAQVFESMVYQATGTVDPTNTPSSEGNLSIALSGIIKKNKKSVVNFQEMFLIPLITKLANRYMQFDPENFPVADFKFCPIGTLGMLAREVEQLQFINLLKTLGPESEVAPKLLEGVIENSSLPNKETMLEELRNEEPSEYEQVVREYEFKKAQLELHNLEMELRAKEAKVQLDVVRAQTEPLIAKARMIAALSNNLDEDQESVDFERRVKLAELMIKEKDIDMNYDIVREQMKHKEADNA